MYSYIIGGGAVVIAKILHCAFRSCSLCEERTVWKNRIDELQENHLAFEKQDVIPTEAKVICSACYDKHEVTRCAKTGKVFLTEDDCSEQFERDIKKKLSQYHPSSTISGPISPEGLCQIEKEAQHLTCAKTGKVFLTENDCSEQFRLKIKKKLSPYHPSGKLLEAVLKTRTAFEKLSNQPPDASQNAPYHRYIHPICLIFYFCFRAYNNFKTAS